MGKNSKTADSTYLDREGSLPPSDEAGTNNGEAEDGGRGDGQMDSERS